MILRKALARARKGTARGWLVVKELPCRLADEVRFVELTVDGATNAPVLPKALEKRKWIPICDSPGLQAVVRQTDARSGKEDDSACWEATLLYHLLRDFNPDAETIPFAADAAVSRRRAKAHAFISRSGRGIVLAAVAINEVGICYEPDAALLLPPSATPRSVGQAVLDMLTRYRRQARNLRSYKKTELPAFRASGHRSFRAFDRDASFVRLERDEQVVTMILFEREDVVAEMVHLPAQCPVEDIGLRLLQFAQRVATETH